MYIIPDNRLASETSSVKSRLSVLHQFFFLSNSLTGVRVRHLVPGSPTSSPEKSALGTRLSARKRFLSSYCAKVRAEAIKKKLLSSQLSRRTRAETLATQATYTRLLHNFERSKTVRGVLPNHTKTERQDFLRLILLT